MFEGEEPLYFGVGAIQGGRGDSPEAPFVERGCCDASLVYQDAVELAE